MSEAQGTIAIPPARTPRARLASAVAWIGALVALVGPAVALAALLGRLIDALSWHTAFEVLTLQWAPRLCWAGLIAAGVALLASVLTHRARMWAVAWAALIVVGLTLAALTGLRVQSGVARGVAPQPPVHDVATDWSDPIMFSQALLAARGQGANPVERNPSARRPWGPGGGAVTEGWAAQRVADLNRLGCPTARPVMRMIPTATVQSVLEEQGLVIVGAAPWRVEGTARSTWYHLQSDVAVRMRPDRTDVRAVSRQGDVDYGANCRLVTAIVRALDAASRGAAR